MAGLVKLLLQYLTVLGAHSPTSFNVKTNATLNVKAAECSQVLMPDEMFAVLASSMFLFKSSSVPLSKLWLGNSY